MADPRAAPVQTAFRSPRPGRREEDAPFVVTCCTSRSPPVSVSFSYQTTIAYTLKLCPGGDVDHGVSLLLVGGGGCRYRRSGRRLEACSDDLALARKFRNGAGFISHQTGTRGSTSLFSKPSTLELGSACCLVEEGPGTPLNDQGNIHGWARVPRARPASASVHLERWDHLAADHRSFESKLAPL